MAAYGQPLMLEKWWNTLRSYSPEVREKLHVIIVDDHGEPPVAVPRDILDLMSICVYRVSDDIPWNQMGARNLGMQQAPDGWCLMLDPDMVVEPGVAERLLARIKDMRQGELVKLLLRYTNGKLDSSSPNAYLIHRKDFAKVGGYDEDYAGHKGWSDVQLMHTLLGARIRFLRPQDLWVRYYHSEDIADATVRTLSRNVNHNRSMHLRKMGIAKKNWAKWIKREQKSIRFNWTRVV